MTSAPSSGQNGSEQPVDAGSSDRQAGPIGVKVRPPPSEDGIEVKPFKKLPEEVLAMKGRRVADVRGLLRSTAVVTALFGLAFVLVGGIVMAHFHPYKHELLATDLGSSGLLVATGVLALATALGGGLAAMGDHLTALHVYLGCSALVTLMAVVSGSMAYVARAGMGETLAHTLPGSMRGAYGDTALTTALWDDVQSSFSCCGDRGAGRWPLVNPRFGAPAPSNRTLATEPLEASNATEAPQPRMAYPESCCVQPSAGCSATGGPLPPRGPPPPGDPPSPGGLPPPGAPSPPARPDHGGAPHLHPSAPHHRGCLGPLGARLRELALIVGGSALGCGALGALNAAWAFLLVRALKIELEIV